jgi:hypothetical protein
MTVEQVYALVNDMQTEVLGEASILNENLSNIVDIGDSIINKIGYENAAKTLVDHIGKVQFVIRPYNGSVPSVYRDAWEYGSIMEKIQADIPDAEENESWELENGASYDENIYYKPDISAKFYNGMSTFEIPQSLADKQVKSAFSSATQMNSYASMIMDASQKGTALKLDALVRGTINYAIASTINAEFTGGSDINGHTGVRVINLLYLYNQANGTNYTFAQAILVPDWIRFCTYMISLYMGRMSKMSTLFNLGGKKRFTPRDLMHLVLLDDFAEASKIYLQSSTYHDELVQLKGFETVPFFQGSGTSYALNDISKINVTIKTANGTQAVETSGILGCIFDHDALGVTNLNQRVTSKYNAEAEFTNTWYKTDAHFFNDGDENMIVFVAA